MIWAPYEENWAVTSNVYIEIWGFLDRKDHYMIFLIVRIRFNPVHKQHGSYDASPSCSWRSPAPTWSAPPYWYGAACRECWSRPGTPSPSWSWSRRWSAAFCLASSLSMLKLCSHMELAISWPWQSACPRYGRLERACLDWRGDKSSCSELWYSWSASSSCWSYCHVQPAACSLLARMCTSEGTEEFRIWKCCPSFRR